ELRLLGVLSGEQLTAGEAVGDRAEHRCRRMSEYVGAHSERIIEVDVAVDIVQTRSAAPFEAEGYRLAPKPEVAADASGEHGRCFGVMPDRSIVRTGRVRHGHGPYLASSSKG